MAGETAHYLLADEPIEINQGRATVTLNVWNTGDRAIQVGSHFHFFEVNRALRFDRSATFGMRLNIPDTKWFNNVEWAVAESVGSITVNYVRNIFQYFIIYSNVYDRHLQLEKLKKQ